MISFADATGNLFNRLGKLGLLIKQMGSYQTSQLQNIVNTSTGVVGQYNSEPDIQAIIGSSYYSYLGGMSVASTAQQMSLATINRMVFRDNPLYAQNLQTPNIIGSINEVIRQMNAAGATILAATITASASSFSGTGNGVMVGSIRRPLDGLVLENSFAEGIAVSCTQDSFSGGASAGSEGITALGDGSEPDLFAFDWPLGSNGQTTFTAIDGDASGINILTNSGFSSWTGNSLTSWNLIVGVAGTNIFRETSLTYTGGSAVRLVGDAGGTLTSLTQQISLSSVTQYSVNIFCRCGAVAPGAGVLTIDLIDQNNNVINDNNGIANSFTINLTSLNTVYTGFNGVFRTPSILPTSRFIRMRLSTPLTNGATVYLDKMSMGKMTQAYTSGPYLSVHSGSIPFVKGDSATLTITNSRGSGGTLNTFQTLLYRLLYPLSVSEEILFPSSSLPTISDSLIG